MNCNAAWILIYSLHFPVFVVEYLCKAASRMNDRGCMCRKTAGEESPGFIGQDAR